ncbi:MAG TPA: MarR family transcriptional regulator [Acidimicrobiales bacterium]|nr:MarR family transcriptional regulator [Acidimicrobiales bacterium]
MKTLPAPTIADAELASRLRLAVTRLARRLRTQLPGELSPSQLATLATVERLGPLTLGELSAAERVKPPTMTKIVACLEEQGLVSRTVDQSDRRVARVEATAEGRRFLDQSRRRKDAYLAERLRGLDSADREALERAAAVLERLLEAE